MNKSTLNERLGPLFAILSAVLFGTMPLFAKIAYAYGCNSYTAAFGRFLFGAAASGLIIGIHPKLSFRITATEFKSLLLLSLFYAATPVLLYESYQTISSGLATTLHFTYPVIVMVLGAILFRSVLHVKQIVCLLICMSGILCFYRPGAGEGTTGMFLAVFSGLTYALYILFLGKSGLKQLHVMTITFWISLLSAIEIATFAMLGGKLLLTVPWQGWAAVGCLGLFATVLALALFQLGVFLCGEVKAALLSTFEPLTGVILGIGIFHETLTLRITAGILLILLSTVLLVAEPLSVKASERSVHHAR